MNFSVFDLLFFFFNNKHNILYITFIDLYRRVNNSKTVQNNFPPFFFLLQNLQFSRLIKSRIISINYFFVFPVPRDDLKKKLSCNQRKLNCKSCCWLFFIDIDVIMCCWEIFLPRNGRVCHARRKEKIEKYKSRGKSVKNKFATIILRNRVT